MEGPGEGEREERREGEESPQARDGLSLMGSAGRCF